MYQYAISEVCTKAYRTYPDVKNKNFRGNIVRLFHFISNQIHAISEACTKVYHTYSDAKSKNFHRNIVRLFHFISNQIHATSKEVYCNIKFIRVQYEKYCLHEINPQPEHTHSNMNFNFNILNQPLKHSKNSTAIIWEPLRP